MGPENLREYSTKEEICPSDIRPNRNSIAPNMLTKDSDRLLMKLTDGPVMLP